MGIRNVKVKALKKTPPFRKVAIGTWGKPTDPQIYGTIDIDLTKAQAWRKKLPQDGPKVTVTHMIAKAVPRPQRLFALQKDLLAADGGHDRAGGRGARKRPGGSLQPETSRRG
jgi:hypothetical protein